MKRVELRRATRAVKSGLPYTAKFFSNELFNAFPSVQYDTALPELRTSLNPPHLYRSIVQLATHADRIFLNKGVIGVDDLEEAWSDIFQRSVDSTTFSSPKLTVIVPVYNNGRFLLGKCIPSLILNQAWGEMRVVLVDDCSPDPTTLSILQFLKNTLPQVEVVCLTQNSGSASTPRNIGMNSVNTPWVSFLDPDNSISPFGYDALLKLAGDRQLAGQSLDLISGYHVKLSSTVGFTARNASAGVTVYENPKRQLLESGNFPTVSTQAAIISSAFLAQNKISFVPGALGQDTLFGWELLARASRVAFVSNVWLIYFAGRHGSVLNTVSESNSRKFEIRDTYVRDFLEREGLTSVASSIAVTDNIRGSGRDGDLRSRLGRQESR